VFNINFSNISAISWIEHILPINSKGNEIWSLNTGGY